MQKTLPTGYYESALPVVADWGLMVGFTPSLYHAPDSLDALARVLSDAARTPDRKIKVIGGLHSCSTIFQNDIVVDLSRIPLQFECTPSLSGGGGQVVASAHMHVHEFLARAADHGLSLTATGGTDAQVLAGLIATNTAGATVHTTIYETLAWVEYLAPDSTGAIVLRRVTRGDPDFPGMIASLGVVGVMTTVCFDLVPQRFFTATTTVPTPQSVLGDLDATNAKYEFWRIQWLPENDQLCQLWAANPMPGPGPADGDYPPDAAEELASQLMGIAHELGAGFKLDPIVKELYDRLARGYQATRNTGPLRLMIPVDRNAPLRVAMAEWSFAPADVSRAMDVCRAYWNANGWPNLATEVECTKTDDYWMSAWNWPDLDYIVKFNFQYLTSYLTDVEKQGLVAHLQGLWSAFDAAGIPFKAHWGKINFLDPPRVAARYGFERFRPLVWPQLVNDYLAARLPL